MKKKFFPIIWALILGYVIIGVVLVGLYSTHLVTFSIRKAEAPVPAYVYIFNSSSVPLKFSAPQAGIVGSQIAKEFKLNSTYMITGTFTSTYGAEIYIVPTNAMSNSTRFPPRFYTYSTGNVTSGNVSVTLSSGSYYLVIADPTTVSDNITITQSIEAISIFIFA